MFVSISAQYDFPISSSFQKRYSSDKRFCSHNKKTRYSSKSIELQTQNCIPKQEIGVIDHVGANNWGLQAEERDFCACLI